jgi:hypothetical protein
MESGNIETIEQDGRTLRVQCCVGAIETVDREAHTLRIQRQGEAVPLTLVWNSQTRFLKGTRFVTAAELAKGTPVTACITPRFSENASPRRL